MNTDKKESAFNNKWRPAMGWVYMIVCTADFVLFPILWSILQSTALNGIVTAQWLPITLQGAGLFHISMGAILGVTAYGRTQEKMNGVPTVSKPSTKINPNEQIG